MRAGHALSFRQRCQAIGTPRHALPARTVPDRAPRGSAGLLGLPAAVSTRYACSRPRARSRGLTQPAVMRGRLGSTVSSVGVARFSGLLLFPANAACPCVLASWRDDHRPSRNRQGCHTPGRWPAMPRVGSAVVVRVFRRSGTAGERLGTRATTAAHASQRHCVRAPRFADRGRR